MSTLLSCNRDPSLVIRCVSDPPEIGNIVSSPRINSRRYFKENDNVILTCNVTAGNPTGNISWQFKQPLSTPTFVSLSSANTPILRLSRLTKQNNGSYRCVAQNSIGRSESPSVDIKIACKMTVNTLICFLTKPLFNCRFKFNKKAVGSTWSRLSVHRR